MRLHLDNNDLTEKLTTLFAEEGLHVDGLAWGTSDDGPIVMVELGALPTGANRPLRAVVGDLQAQVELLQSRVDDLEGQSSVANLPDSGDPEPVYRQQNQGNNKKNKHNKQHDNKPKTFHVSPKMAAVAEQIEREADLLGPKMARGERILSNHETLEYPTK